MRGRAGSAVPALILRAAAGGTPSGAGSKPTASEATMNSTAGFVVAHQPPEVHQDPEGLFHPPPGRLHDEPDIGRVALHDLHVDAESGAVLDDRLLEALVHPDLADRRHGGGDLVQQLDPDRVLVGSTRTSKDKTLTYLHRALSP